MNKSKLKFLIGSILAFNFFVCAEKSFAAIRKNFSRARSGQSPSTSSSTSRSQLTRPIGATARPQGPQGPRTTFATLTSEEVKSGLDSAKKLLNEGNYIMPQRLENTLKFMKHSEEDFKKTFNSLTYDDYHKTRDNKQHASKIYVFNKNNPETGNIYIKFALNKDLENLSIVSYNNDEIIHEATKDIPTISTILNEPNFTKLNLVGRSVDKALSIIKNKVSSYDYFKAPRVAEELKNLRYKGKDFRNIILSLEKKHYISGPELVHPGTGKRAGTVWVFGYNDEIKGNELYIKFLISPEENELNVLSFHPTDRPLNFFFKDLQ